MKQQEAAMLKNNQQNDLDWIKKLTEEASNKIYDIDRRV